MYKEFLYKGYVDIFILNFIIGYFDKKYYRVCQIECKKKLVYDMDEYLNLGIE